MSDFIYDPSDWFWRVAGETRVYSSAARGYLAETDDAVQAFLATGAIATPVPDEATVFEVLAAQYPQGLPVDLKAYAAQKRWELEVGGVIVGGMPVSTTRESQSLIHGAYSYAKDDLIESFRFKSEAGFVTLLAPQIIAIGKAVAEHVQACFVWEADTHAAIDAGSVTSEADIDALAQQFSMGMV